MTAAPAVNLREISPRDIAALTALAQAAFDVAWTDDFVAWKYFQNPAGAAFGGCAESDGRIVASFSNLPVRLKIGNQAVMAAQAVDAMVLVEYRRQKLFYQLARQTYQDMDRARISMTYVFPAPAIRAAFVNQLGYLEAGPVPRYVKVARGAQLAQSLGHGQTKAMLDRLTWRAARFARSPAPARQPAPDVQVVEIDQFDERFDRLWQKASLDFPIATIRDAAYLNWRYRQNPLRRYVILAAERASNLAGYAILSIDHDRHIAQVVELIVAPGDEAAGLRLLAEVNERGQQADCGQIQCWMLPQHEFYVSLLRQSGYVYWPARALPNWLRSVTPFIIRPGAGPEMAVEAARLENWYLSMGDHDYY